VRRPQYTSPSSRVDAKVPSHTGTPAVEDDGGATRTVHTVRRTVFSLARLVIRPAFSTGPMLTCRHLRRYLLPLMPSSRVEVFTTPRYTAVTKHTELAVFATRPLAPGTVLQELQGSVVPLPDAWREEMEIGEDFAYRAAEEDEDFSDSEAGSDDEDGDESGPPKEKHKGKERDSESRSRGARRSDRTKRRDFSIVWSGLKRCFQLFLGPARFLNVSPDMSLYERDG